jgi:ubiquinone biosynthesis protein COQ4
MQTETQTSNVDPIWRERALGTIVDSVRASVGDFSVLQRMTDVMHDEQGRDADLLIEILGADPPSAAILEQRRLVGGLDLAELGRLSPGSLGRCYAAHMERNHLRPPPIPDHYRQMRLEKFVQRRLLELHDVWHVALGFDTDTVGEVGIGAFNVGQLPTRFFTAMLAKNLAKIALEDIGLCPAILRAMDRGLALARSTRPLFGYPWDERWSHPLAEVRAELGLPLS